METTSYFHFAVSASASPTILPGVISGPDLNFRVCGLSDLRSLMFEPPTSMTRTTGPSVFFFFLPGTDQRASPRIPPKRRAARVLSDFFAPLWTPTLFLPLWMFSPERDG